MPSGDGNTIVLFVHAGGKQQPFPDFQPNQSHESLENFPFRGEIKNFVRVKLVLAGELRPDHPSLSVDDCFCDSFA